MTKLPLPSMSSRPLKLHSLPARSRCREVLVLWLACPPALLWPCVWDTEPVTIIYYIMASIRNYDQIIHTVRIQCVTVRHASVLMSSGVHSFSWEHVAIFFKVFDIEYSALSSNLLSYSSCTTRDNLRLVSARSWLLIFNSAFSFVWKQ